MLFTAEHLAKMSQTYNVVNANMRSLLIGLQMYGQQAGLAKAHRLPHFLCQVAHESMGWKYDREIWGPTAAQKGYEGRKDLGNILPGDGSLFRGYGPIQVTGRANTTEFHNWCLAEFGQDVPDFVKTPSLINTDPWEGISAVWYWHTRDLNYYADRNNLEAITRKINGGINGLPDRFSYYTRCALVLLGYGPTQVKEFQAYAGFTGKDVDGIAGAQTRSALHKHLSKLEDFTFSPETPAGPTSQVDLVAKAEALMSEMQTLIDQLKGTTL